VFTGDPRWVRGSLVLLREVSNRVVLLNTRELLVELINGLSLFDNNGTDRDTLGGREVSESQRVEM